MKIKVLYIISSSFSGSTILGFLLGASESVFNSGEILHFDIDYEKPCSFCSCGKTFQTCDFWRMVRDKFMQTTDNSTSSEYCLFKSIYEEASKISNIEYILDNSKDLKRLERLSSISELDLYVIYLIRDLRGVANSNKKHRKGYRFLKTVHHYFMYQKKIESYLRRSRKKYIRIDYDDLCLNTLKVISLINGFLRVRIKDNYIDMINDTTQHVFTGNIGAREGIKKITMLKLDNSFERLNRIERFIGTVLWMMWSHNTLRSVLIKTASFYGILYRNAVTLKSFISNCGVKRS